jgi:hypothetical protein
MPWIVVDPSPNFNPDALDFLPRLNNQIFAYFKIYIQGQKLPYKFV